MLKGTARKPPQVRHLHPDRIRRRRGCPDRSQQERQRFGALDQYRLGPRRDARHLCVGGRIGRAFEPGRYRRARRAPRVPVEQGRPYTVAQIAGAFAASALVYATYREALLRLRRRPAHGRGRYRHCRHSGDVSAAVPVDCRRVRRSGRRTRADGRRPCGHRSKERRRAGLVHRPAGRHAGDRDSASRSVSTPVTPSTRRATSARASSHSSPVGDRTCSRPAAAGGGCPSSRQSSARFSAPGCTTRSSTSTTWRQKPADD